METPLISVIIPAYNVAVYLERTLDSVLAQTYSNMEVIVVNDGSSDSTAQLLDAYAAQDPRVRAIHKENGGVTSARLRGVAEASGQWIGFVDGDDYIEPDMYRRLMDNALTHCADISHCGYQMVFPNRKDLYYGTGKLHLQDHITGLSDLLSGQFVEPGLCNKLFRKDLFRQMDERMDTSIKNNEDLLMNYWLFKAAGSSVFEDFCPYHYIVRKGSAANASLNDHLLRDPLRVTRILLKDCSEALRPIVYRSLVYKLVGYSTMPGKDHPQLILPYRKECRRELRKNLSRILFGRDCGLKLKIMALWTSVWPWSYYIVHKLYAVLNGSDKKYHMDE